MIVCFAVMLHCYGALSVVAVADVAATFFFFAVAAGEGRRPQTRRTSLSPPLPGCTTASYRKLVALSSAGEQLRAACSPLRERAGADLS